MLPGPRHLDRAAVRVAVAAHALDDALCEAHPDLLVVVELGVAMEVGERRPARVVVPGRVELEAVPRAEAAVALGPEVGARPGDREVDVEDDGAEVGHPPDDSLVS